MRDNLFLSKNYISSCPLGCNSEIVDTEIIRPEGCLKLCAQCGQLFSQCTETFYRESMMEFDDPKGTWPPPENSPRLVQSTSKVIRKIEKLTAKNRSQIRLLDVGCSSGAFINTAANMGVPCEGVEPAQKAAEAAKSAGLMVYQGLLGDCNLQAESYDVITMFEVIEHVKDPVLLLNECCRLLKKHGVLVIRTANTESWTVKVLKGKWEYFDIKKHGGHVSFFGKKSMSILAQRTGFRIEKLLTHSVILGDIETTPYIMFRLLKILSESLNLPAKLCGKGQEMEVFLRKSQ